MPHLIAGAYVLRRNKLGKYEKRHRATGAEMKVVSDSKSFSNLPPHKLLNFLDRLNGFLYRPLTVLRFFLGYGLNIPVTIRMYLL